MYKYLEELWSAGVMIVGAAGNHGPEPMSISPIRENGCCLCVSCHDEGFVGKNGKSCSEYSGRGPGKGVLYFSRRDNPLKKPDIVAPAVGISTSEGVRSGTSYSAALAAGAAGAG